MRSRPHDHPCQRCGVLTACHGTLERNYDGWPEVICVKFDTYAHPDFLCEECADAVPEVEADEEPSPDPVSWGDVVKVLDADRQTRITNERIVVKAYLEDWLGRKAAR